MKHFMLALTALAVSSAACAAGDNDHSIFPSTEINFEGRIIAQACEIGTDLNGAPVQLGTYPAEHFKSINVQTAPVNFNLKLSKCRLVQTLTGATDEIEVETSSLTFTDQSGDTQTMPTYNHNHLLAPIAEAGETTATNIGVLVKYAKAGEPSVDFDSDDGYAIVGSSTTVPAKNMRIEEDGVTIPMAAVMQRASDAQDVTPGKVKARMKVVLQYK